MNRNQKIILMVALVLFVLMGLFPPWLESSVNVKQPGPVMTHATEYAPLFWVPSRWPSPDWRSAYRVDMDRLSIQWTVLLAIAGAGLLIARPGAKT
jgi:hypothetical protein